MNIPSQAIASLLNYPSLLEDMNEWAIAVSGDRYWQGGATFNKSFRLIPRVEFRFGVPPYRPVYFLEYEGRSMAWAKSRGGFKRSPERCRPNTA